MSGNDTATIKARIDKIRQLIGQKHTTDYYEAACLAQSVLHDTLGGAHPTMVALDGALKNADWTRALAASRAVVALYDQGALRNPRLAIAGEIESDLLAIAQAQAQAAESSRDAAQKQVHLAIAAFLAGTSLEDGLRRLCDAHQIQYDTHATSISKLQTALYQPSKSVEVISQSENKHITAWGDTRNKADHGKFGDITLTEVVSMVLGIRSFVEKHLS